MRACCGLWAVVSAVLLCTGVAQGENTKTRSVLLPAPLAARAQANAASHAWAAEMQRQLVVAAERWLVTPDDDLWAMIFGPAVTRSWMVWSDGYCPACRRDVRMYAWEIDPWAAPWKVRCPHCRRLFPTNDFAAYHASGLDAHGLFDPARADRSLLFNADVSDASSPERAFGVDDGEGYVADGHRWRFIGCYLIYGQWKRLICNGIIALSAAWAVTGEPRYAYKAALLLDRVADVFPQFDFSAQGLVYESRDGTRGQVSTWHDACEEVRELALAYDRIFDGARAQEEALVAFLSRKAVVHQLPNPKQSWADIQRNIEENIFRNTLRHPDRIQSNYPRTDMALLTIEAVLEWPANRPAILERLDSVINQSTAVDGLSGEKGLAGYSAIAPRALAEVLPLVARLEPGFLDTVFQRHPVLHQTWRFHVDTHCLDAFYPSAGDAGRFGRKVPDYAGVTFPANPGVAPSMYSFFWDLYRLTADPVFVQVLHRANGFSTDGLPHDLFADDPTAFTAQVQAVIDRVGTHIALGSVNKEQWCLAILRSGEGAHRRALWIDYDVSGSHRHADGMNLGLFAKGLDLIPDFGYPPVGYGGWGAPKARWYMQTAAHVTVTVDGQDHREARGKTSLWADGAAFRAIRVECPALIAGRRFERTACLVDLDKENFYVVDCLRAEGGLDHANFFHSFFGTLATHGLTLEATEDYGQRTEMRNFQCAAAPNPGWYADWRIEDVYDYLEPKREVHLRYTGLTRDALVYTAEGWVEKGQYGGEEAWIPRILVRRRSAEAPLASTFVAIVEPYETQPLFTAIQRMDLRDSAGLPLADSAVGIELVRTDGKREIVLLADPQGDTALCDTARKISFQGQVARIVTGETGVEGLAVCRTTSLRVGELHLHADTLQDYAELEIGPSHARLVRGTQEHWRVERGGVPLVMSP